MVPGIIIPKHVTIHPDTYTASLLLQRDYKYEHTGANNTINTSCFGWYCCVRAVHGQVLSFLTSLLDNSDRNLSDAAHTQDVSRTARWPPPKKFHFRILRNMLQIPAGNVRCIRGKGKGARGSTNNKGTPSEGSRGLCWSPLCARSEEQAGSVWHRDTWPRKQGNAQRRFCASPAVPRLCSCQKISAVLDNSRSFGFCQE